MGGRQAIIGCPASGSRKCVDAVLDLLSASQWRLVVTCGLRLRVVLVDGQGAAIGAFRFGILLQAMEGGAQIAERVRIVRLQRDRPFKGNNGIFDPVEMKESDPKNAMGVRIIGIPSSCVVVRDFNSRMRLALLL